MIFWITEVHGEIRLTIDIPSSVLQFRLYTAHRRCAFKNVGVFDSFPFNYNVVLGVSGIALSPWGVVKGGSAGSDPPFDYFYGVIPL